MTKRQAVLRLLSAGIITQAEAARLANVTRQTIQTHCTKHNIDAQGARKAYLVKLLARIDEKRAPAK